MPPIHIRTPEGIIFTPHEKQRAFLESPAANKCFLGGFGAGKTLVGGVAVLAIGLTYKGTGRDRGRCIIARYNWDELVNTTWQTLKDIIPDEILKRSRITQSPLKITLPNGFQYIGYNLKNHQKFGSEKIVAFWGDEINEDGVQESIYLQVQGRMRTQQEGQILLTGNPGGRNWVYKYFFAYQFENGAKRYPNHEGFLAGTEENKHLPQHYLDRMKAIYPQQWLDRYFSGGASAFEVFEGQILEGFDEDIHVVPDFRVPSEWPRYFGLDHGIDHPTAAVWIASDYDGNLIVYREHRRSSAVPRQNADDILLSEQSDGVEPEWRVCDPSMRERQTAGGFMQSIIEQYREANLYLQEGNNDVPASIVRLKALLAPDPKRKFPHWHPRAGEEGAPSLYILESCKGMKWELVNWKWKDMAPGYSGKPRVLAKNDDLVAALRYVVMRSPQPARLDESTGRYGWLARLHQEADYPELLRPEEYIGSR